MLSPNASTGSIAGNPALEAAFDLAVIIVSWNVRDLVCDAIRTVRDDLHESGLQAGIWLVDNASADGTVDTVRAQFPEVHMIASDRNLGFAAGNNSALHTLGFATPPNMPPYPQQPRAVLLLNPDTRTERGAVRAMFDALFSLPKAGVVGARLNYEDGTFQHSAFHFPGLLQILIDLYPIPDRLRSRLYETRWNGRYARRLWNGNAPFRVDHPLGAAMMLRREAILQSGILDEHYFMYVEEVDWCKRIRRAGWQIYAVPAARIVHLEGRSTRQIRPQSITNLWRSRFIFFRKYYPPWRLALARALVHFGMWLKIAAVKREPDMSAEERTALISAYGQIMRL